MKRDKQKTSTELNELVQTHNIALAIQRLKDSPIYDRERVGRAIYHAFGMVGFGDAELARIRAAFELP